MLSYRNIDRKGKFDGDGRVGITLSRPRLLLIRIHRRLGGEDSKPHIARAIPCCC